MACGTPVIGYRRGSVPEILDEGVTGFIVDDLDTAVECVVRAAGLSRKRCRERFEQRLPLISVATSSRIAACSIFLPCQLLNVGFEMPWPRIRECAPSEGY